MGFEQKYIENDRLFDMAASAARLYKSSGTVSGKKLSHSIESVIKQINSSYASAEEKYGESAKVPTEYEWLLDNRYLAVREAKNAMREFSAQKKLRSCDDGVIILKAAEMLVSAGRGELDGDRIRLFLEGFQSVSPLPRAELYLFPDALRLALVMRISDCKDAEGMAAIFSSLRFLASEDIGKIAERVDITEKLLMSDPANVYPNMSEVSRRYYREALSKAAEKAGLEEHRYAASLLEKANKEKRHIGFELFPDKEKSGALYIGANILITLFLTLLCGFLSKSFLAAALLLLPVSELTKSLIDYIVLLTVKPAFLPRMEYPDGIPEEGKTVCVISALLTKKDSGDKLCERLERFYLSNRNCGDKLLFGILADLPEAANAVTGADAALISGATKAIERLNAKYGQRFYLFTRPRVKDIGRNIYSGKERKRGAVLALAKLINGEKSELRVSVGDKESLLGTKYILTLDSDTSLLPDTATELIGAMLHPLNRAVIDEDKGIVKSGHGIIFPRMCTEIKSVYATDFSRIFAGSGGCEPYSALCGELYMDLFDRGGFPGKGIIDANALLACSEHIEDGLVLSHDALEGAYLRGGYMSDIEFSDSYPTSALSFFRRSHRWTRGDWQNIGWIFSKSAELPDIERWKLFDSVRRSLVPPFTLAAIFLGLFYGTDKLILAGLAAFLALCTRLLIALCEFVSASRDDLELKFHSRLLSGLSLAFAQTFFRLWFLPYEAWICLSAAVTSVWRMTVSGKNLLEWETSAQNESKKSGLLSYYRNMWLSPLYGIILLTLSYGALSKLVGLLWIVAPVTALALSMPLYSEPRVDREMRRYLIECADDIWGYFEKFCSKEDNYLPPDNFQEQPPVGIAHRTSPTNIGFALCSCLCAVKLGIDRNGSAMKIIENAITTLEKLPRYRGHFLNWYDTRTLRPLEPKYVSTVDSGNIYASLLALKNGLCKLNHNGLAERIDALLSDMDFRPLYDEEKRLFYIGYDLEKHQPSPGRYDLMASESRLTSYIAVAKGDVPRKHWRSLSRAMLKKGGYQGMASWTGTMFEYLMPELFLPLSRDSLLFESAKYCLYVQKGRRAPTDVWGISESAFFSLDSALNYRYKANGCSFLALKRGQDRELVISPYSSFLALGLEPSHAVRNLRRLENIGARGRYGFFEAIDYTSSRCRSENGEIIRSYMAHHLGMSMIAITNCLADGYIQKLFMLSPEMRSYDSLLHEKLPQSSAVLQLRENVERKSDTPSHQWQKRGEDFDFESPECSVLSNGRYSIMLTETMRTLSTCENLLIYKPVYRPFGDKGGITMGIKTNDTEYSFLPEVNLNYVNCLWELGESSCFSLIENDVFTAKCSTAVSGSDNGEIRYLEIAAKREIKDAAFTLEFEPVLADYSDYVNHPAFWALGLEAYVDSDCLMIKRFRRGDAPELWLCLACDRLCSFAADRYGALGYLSSPYVTASFPLSLKAGERLSLRFALCIGESADTAYSGARHMLAIGAGEYGSLVSASASVLGLDADEVGRAMQILSPCLFPRQSNSPFAAKRDLWPYGLSGDMPIICADENDIENSVKRFCLLRSCGFNGDLVFFSDEGGEYSRPLYSKILDTLSEYGLEALLNVHGGIRILPTEAKGIVTASASYIEGTEKAERRTNQHYLPSYAKPRRAATAPSYDWDKDGSFVFYVNQSLPSRTWSNMLTNGSFGYLATDCGGGNMWYYNAREMRINNWSNDPYAVSGPERLEYISPNGRYSLFAANDGFACRVKFGFGFASWEKNFGEGGTRVTAFVPIDADARVFIIESTGSLQGKISWSTELQLSDGRDDEMAVSCDYVNFIFSAVGTRAYLRGTKFQAAASEEALGWTCELFSFLRGDFNGSTGGGVPIFAAEYPTEKSLIIACGCCESERLIELCKLEAALNALDTAKKYWSEKTCFSYMGNNDIAHMLNGWAVYQTVACRLMGRCSVYQSGGAIGFRDQLQDAVNMLLVSDEYCKEQIIASCAHQYLEGDVMHWWHPHPDGDKGVRTRCSDDMLWLVWALCEYVEKTGDTGFCAQKICYVNSHELESYEHDRYETP